MCFWLLIGSKYNSDLTIYFFSFFWLLVIENPKNNFKIFLVSKGLSSHVQYKLQNQPRPKVTDYILSVIQHLLMQDGWCVDREYFPMYSCSIANIMFIYVLKHPQNAPTYLLTIKALGLKFQIRSRIKL